MSDFIDVTDKCTFSPDTGTVINQDTEINVIYTDTDTGSVFQTNFNVNSYPRSTFDKPFNISNIIINGSNLLNNCYNFNSIVKIGGNVEDLSGMFYNCSNFDKSIIIPDKALNLSYMFYNCSKFNQDVDIPSSIIDASYMFYYCANFDKNVTIHEGIKNISGMFGSASNFNKPIYIPESVEDMSRVCAWCGYFDHPITLRGNSYASLTSCYNFKSELTIDSSVTNLAEALSGTNISSPFTIPDKEISYAYCFSMCRNFNQSIQLTRATNVRCLIQGCTNFNKPITWVRTIQSLGGSTTFEFQNCKSLNQSVTIPSGINNTSYMFDDCDSFNQSIDIPDTVKKADRMFAGCKSFDRSISLSNIENCWGIFDGCINLNSTIYIGQNAKNISGMFSGCTNFDKSITIPDNVIYCSYLLSSCKNFNNSIIFGSNVEDLSSALYNCENFNKPITLPQKLKKCYGLFSSSGFNQEITIPFNVTNVKSMFSHCRNFEQDNIFIYGDEITDSNQMFYTSAHPAVGYAWGPNIRNIYIYSNNFNVRGMLDAEKPDYLQARHPRINIYCKDFSRLKDINNICRPGTSWLNPDWNTSISGCMFNSNFNIYIYNNLT